MKVFKNTKRFKIITIILIFITLFNFIFPNISNAAAGDWWDVLGNIKEGAKLVFNQAVCNIYVSVAQIMFWIVDLPQRFLNQVFVDDKDGDGEPDVSISAEKVIRGEILLMNANIFKTITESDKTKYHDYNKVIFGRNNLHNRIAGWYYALRNLAIVALLSVLAYVSIRMVTSTISQDKAKYKVMFKDWLVALCLVFTLHYIMVGILNMTDTITNSFGTGRGVDMTDSFKEYVEYCIYGAETWVPSGEVPKVKEWIAPAFKYMFMYLVIVGMNILFIIKYIKRSITITFLILLAPISCITYPIDKISDGKAQAYNMWFQEFLYNVIIQPFHILLYIVLIGSGSSLIANNIVYAMVCFGVMIPAEQFIKQMFGFRDKLGSPLGSFAGGAIAGQALSKIFSGGGSKIRGKTGGKEDGDNGSTEKELPPKTVDKDGLMYGGDNTGISERNNIRSHQSQLGENTNSGDNTQLLNETNEDSSGFDNVEPEGDSVDDSGINYLGGAGAGNAYQDYDGDSVAAAEKEALEEKLSDGQLTEDELTDEQRKLLGRDNNDENINPDGNIIDEDNVNLDENIIDGAEDLDLQGNNVNVVATDIDTAGDTDSINNRLSQEQQYEAQRLQAQHQEEQKSQERTRLDVEKDNRRQLASIHNQRMAKKWGSTSRGKRWVNRGGRLARTLARTAGRGALSVGKTAVRGAAVLTGAAALGAFGAMFGQGKAAAGLGASLGANLSNKAISGVSNLSNRAYNNISSAASDYRNGMRNDDSREKAAKQKFEADKKQIDKAVYSYRKNHDGQNPNRMQLQQEMGDRFELSRYGLTDDQIDDSLELYQNKNQEILEREATNKGIDLNELKEQATDKKGQNFNEAKYRNLLEQKLKKAQNGEQTIEKAKNIAASQAKQTADLAKAYSTKDFRDSKTMQTAYDNIVNGLAGENPSEQRMQLADNYARKYLSDAGAMHGVVNVPLPPRKSEETFARKMLTSRGISEPNSEQLALAEEMQIRLQEAGYEENQILQIAEGIDFNESTTPAELKRHLKVYVDYEAEEGKVNVIKEFLGSDATDNEIRQEYIERVEIEKIFNLKSAQDQPKVEAIRAYEKNSGSTTHRTLAARIIKGDISQKELYETKISDKNTANQYKELKNGNANVMQKEIDQYKKTQEDKRKANKASNTSRDKQIREDTVKDSAGLNNQGIAAAPEQQRRAVNRTEIQNAVSNGKDNETITKIEDSNGDSI